MDVLLNSIIETTYKKFERLVVESFSSIYLGNSSKDFEPRKEKWPAWD